MLLTCSYEGIFLIIYYDYLQLWIKMKRNTNNKEDKSDKFNLIDILFFIFISYTSFFSLQDVNSIREFDLPSISRFTSKDNNIKTLLIMIKSLLPSLLATASFFEICEIYNYSILDSLIVLISMCEIMNLKFFYEIRDFGSWLEIGMSIAFFVISNVVALMQILTFSLVKLIFWICSNKSKYEELKNMSENMIPSNQNIELGLKQENYNNEE